MSTVITPPLTSFVVPYPDFASRLANAIVYANSSEYPAASSLKIEQRYDSDNNTFVPSVSTILIYPQMTLLTKSIETTNATSFGDTASVDAFGRLRVSLPRTLKDSKQTFDNLPFTYNTIVSGTATSQWLSGDSCSLLSTAASGDYVIRQSYQAFNYSPGKSQLVFCTGVLSTETNIVKRFGLYQSTTTAPYSALEGFYFENNAGTLSFNIGNPNGTVGSQTAIQSNWNIDKLDGTGASGITLDMSKTQIFVLDFEWLGAGRVRMGFVINGLILYCHEFNNANVKNSTYLRMPNLPLRTEIRQTGAGSGSMRQICSTVIQETGADDIGNLASIDFGVAVVQFTKNINAAFLAVKIRPEYQGITTSIENINILTDSNVNIRYQIVVNPVYSSSLTYSVLTNTPYLTAGGNGSITASGGKVLYTGYANQKSEGTFSIPGDLLRLGFGIDGTSDVLGLNVYVLGANNAAVFGSINLKYNQ